MARVANTEEYIEKGAYRINPHYAKEYIPEYADIAARMKATGATDKDLAFYFDTSTDRIRQWRKEHPEFSRACKAGRDMTKQYLLKKGMMAAAGYEYTERSVKGNYNVKEDGSLELIPGTTVTVTETPKIVPPNDKLLIFMVSAMDRQAGKYDWVSKQYIESKHEETITHKLDASAVADQIDRLAGNYAKRIDVIDVTPEKTDEQDDV